MPFHPFPPADDDAWSDAPLFHLFWQNGDLNPSRAVQMGQRIARDAVRPSGTPQPMHGAAGWPLPEAVDDHEAAVWRQRASVRTFAGPPATPQDLGRLLYPLRARPDGQTRLLPSGGAKYPLQVYVALCRVAGAPGLERQIAWYDCARHSLAPVCSCPPWQTLAAALGVDWPHEPAAVIFLMADPRPMLAKYGERGGRFLLMEAGIYLGALSYQVAQAGWAGCAIGSFHDDRLLALLGLQARRHLAVAAYACGPRPSGTAR
uniref:SagB/ThcOx family dehydrogenase n=1 Tax=Castellaniella defragrans TaxID=75697 RepID=UPI00333F1890